MSAKRRGALRIYCFVIRHCISSDAAFKGTSSTESPDVIWRMQLSSGHKKDQKLSHYLSASTANSDKLKNPPSHSWKPSQYLAVETLSCCLGLHDPTSKSAYRPRLYFFGHRPFNSLKKTQASTYMQPCDISISGNAAGGGEPIQRGRLALA